MGILDIVSVTESKLWVLSEEFYEDKELATFPVGSNHTGSP